MSHRNMSDFDSFSLFRFALEIKLKNVDYGSH